MPAAESSYPDPRVGGVIDIAAVTAATMVMPTPSVTGHARIATTSLGLGTHPAEPDRSAGTRGPTTANGNSAGSTGTLSTRPAPSVCPLATLTTRLWTTGFS